MQKLQANRVGDQTKFKMYRVPTSVYFMPHRHLFRMQVFHFFGWLWIMNFIIALGQCVLAGAFAQWYFTYQKEVSASKTICYKYRYTYINPAVAIAGLPRSGENQGKTISFQDLEKV